eukprot:COSAG04_NODE_545_length_12819_cov_3.351179_5_plen_184_part_00
MIFPPSCCYVAYLLRWTDWSWVLLGLLILMNLILSILVEGHIKARELIYDQDDLPTMKEKLAEEILNSPLGKRLKAASPRLHEALSPEKPGAGGQQGDGSDRGATVSARAARRGRGNEGQTAMLKQELRAMKQLMTDNQEEMKRREAVMMENQQQMQKREEEMLANQKEIRKLLAGYGGGRGA